MAIKLNMPNIALYEASPKEWPHSSVQGGVVDPIVDTIETSDIMAINDTVTLCRLPVDAILLSFKMAVDDLGSAGDIELGFYRTIGDGAAAIDIDIIAALIDVNTAATALTEFRFDTLDINTVKQPVWDIAGVSARPDYEFLDVKANFLEASTAAGTISIIVLYSM
ncbi:MAG: hypothetical protein IIB38_09430 [Candidatus Hydrogenedentes bacterium]|nr:hypothetical protein [Candidatus Hydrogenedentota bacterium]